MRDGDDAGFFQGFGGDKELVPVGGHFGTGFFERCIAGPQPVHPVHVHGGGNVAALVFHDIGHHGWQQAVPLFGFGDIVDVGQHALSGPLLQCGAFDLRGRGRIARHHPRLEHGHGVVTTATGHSEVFPSMAFGLQCGLQRSGRLGLTAAGPVMQHFHFASMCGDRQGRHRGQHSALNQGQGMFFQESLHGGDGLQARLMVGFVGVNGIAAVNINFTLIN